MTRATMTTNGYTKVPHDLARCARLTLAARAVWTLIAGMPAGYRPTLDQWLDMAGVSENTWRRIVRELECVGLLVVDGGRRPSYEAVFSPANTQFLSLKPSKIEGKTLKNCALNPQNLREKHSNFEPSIYRRTEEQENSERARTREKDFLGLVKNDTYVIDGCRILGVDRERYLELVDEVTSEWRFTDQPDEEWNMRHFLGQARIKEQIRQRQNNETTKTKRADRRRAAPATDDGEQSFGGAV